MRSPRAGGTQGDLPHPHPHPHPTLTPPLTLTQLKDGIHGYLRHVRDHPHTVESRWRGDNFVFYEQRHVEDEQTNGGPHDGDGAASGSEGFAEGDSAAADDDLQ